MLHTHPRTGSTGRRDTSDPMDKGGAGAEGGGASGSPAAASNLHPQDSTPDTVLGPSPGPANSLTCSTARVGLEPTAQALGQAGSPSTGQPGSWAAAAVPSEATRGEDAARSLAG